MVTIIQKLTSCDQGFLRDPSNVHLPACMPHIIHVGKLAFSILFWQGFLLKMLDILKSNNAFELMAFNNSHVPVLSGS